MKPRIRLVKGYGVPPQEPDELEAAIKSFLLVHQAIKPGTLRQYRRILALYRELNPEWPPTREGAAKFIAYCQERYETSTTHNYFGIVRNFVHFLLKEELITRNPLQNITTPRRPKLFPRAPLDEHLKELTNYLEAEVERVLSAHKPYKHWGWRVIRNLALFSLMIDSGLRVFEATNIRLDDIRLGRLGEVGSIFVRDGKGDRQREVPFGKNARGDLGFWLDYRKLINIPPDSPGRDFLFISQRHGYGPMAEAHVRYTLKCICKRMGTGHLTPHLLRHFFASFSHKKGAPAERVMRWLGHSDLETTTRYLMSREELSEHLKSSPRDHL